MNGVVASLFDKVLSFSLSLSSLLTPSAPLIPSPPPAPLTLCRLSVLLSSQVKGVDNVVGEMSVLQLGASFFYPPPPPFSSCRWEKYMSRVLRGYFFG